MIKVFIIIGMVCFIALMFKIHYGDGRLLTTNETITAWLYILQTVLLILTMGDTP